MNNTVNQWLDNRVTLVTGKSAAELREIGEEINSRAFYIAKLSVAAIANPLREISDEYVRGNLTLEEARERIRQIASGSPDEIAKQLARRSRATQVLQNQRQQARGIAEWQSWMENKEDFPYIIYHANQDGFVRPSHKALDGRVFHVDDPFLRTHMPGEWDYNCRCWGEQATKKRGEREAAKHGGIQPPGQGTFDAESGYMFDPANAFMPDASQLKDKAEVVQSMAESVRHGNIRKMGMIVSSPAQPYQRADLAGVSQMTAAMQTLQQHAEASAKKANWDYKKQPGYQWQEELFATNNPDDRHKLPDAIRQAWSGEIRVGNVSPDACKNAGINAGGIPVVLDLGGKEDGLAHNWQHHKEVFLDPAEGERILRATLGNDRSQISVTFENQGKTFRQVLTFFDPKTKSYCVLRYDDHDDQNKVFRLVSWHRSPASYGEGEWEIRGMPTPELDETGTPVLDGNGKPVLITDKTRQKDYWRRQHAKKLRRPPTPAPQHVPYS